MARSTYVHSCPSWIAGPRALHPKFGGGVIVNGMPRVEDRLRAIANAFPGDYSSGHIFLEVAANDTYPHLNKEGAVTYGELARGIEEKYFPRWSAFTSPAFAIPGLENGAILNQDSDIQTVAYYGHCLAIKRSRELKKKGLGLGHTIWWPARDSRLHRGPLSTISVQDARDALKKFWLKAAEEVGPAGDSSPTILFEFKPNIPGDLDFMPTMRTAIRFCHELNQALGFMFMAINLEWAHALIGGQSVKEATRMQLDAGLFAGLVHPNSAQLAIIEWDNAETKIVRGTPGDDSDWAVGEGGQERWDDQQAAVKLLLDSGISITFEHDIDPMGEDPMECYRRSRANLEKMIQAA